LYALGGFYIRTLRIDVITNADTGVSALQAIQANYIQTFIFRIRGQNNRGRVSFTRDF
jgi:hypothetical protein